MSNYNSESERNGVEFEAETGQKISTRAPNVNGGQQSQSQITKQELIPRDSEVGKWTKSDKGFWGFTNYDNLLSEYKKIIPREAGWKGGVTDPFNGQQWFGGVNINDRAKEYGVEVLRVWMIESKPRGSGSYSGGSKSKVWYNQVGCELVDVKSANSLLASNEDSKTGTRYRVQGSHVIKEITEDPDNPGKSRIVENVQVLLVLEKREG
jgi:hypothetical protein